MARLPTQQKKKGIFYGWWIVLASTAATSLSGGLYFYGFSAFFLPLIREFGWSRAALSGTFSLSRVEGGILGPLGGYLVDRFGPRRVMLACVFLMGVGYVLLSRTDSMLTFYLVFILLVSLGASGLHIPTVVAIANWFNKKRSRAMGIVLSGVGLGGPLVPLLAWIIERYGWRQAMVLAGLLIWLVGMPVALVMRHRPEQYGYLPDGESPSEAPLPGTSLADDPLSGAVQARSGGATPELADDRTFEQGASQKGTEPEESFSPRQAVRTRAFWLLTLAFGLRQFVVSAVVVHQIPLLVEVGIRPEVAAAMLGALGLISIVGRMGFGWLGDLVEKRYVMASTLALLSLGSFIFANVTAWWHVIPFLAVYPPAYGGGAVLMFAIRAEYFGRRSFGTVSGLMDFFQMFGLVLGPVFAGWIYDVTGSYRLAFTIFAVGALFALALLLTVRRPRLHP